jgi:hypothetical protein
LQANLPPKTAHLILKSVYDNHVIIEGGIVAYHFKAIGIGKKMTIKYLTLIDIYSHSVAMVTGQNFTFAHFLDQFSLKMGVLRQSF